MSLKPIDPTLSVSRIEDIVDEIFKKLKRRELSHERLAKKAKTELRLIDWRRHRGVAKAYKQAAEELFALCEIPF